MPIKGKQELLPNYFAFKMKFTRVNNWLADSFSKKIDVTGQNVEAKIQKTLLNIHWEKKKRN